MEEQNLAYPTSHSVGKKLINILMMALLFGLGWQIRGSGTSDPTVVIFLFLLFLGVLFSPKKKMNFYFFGLVIFVFRMMRRGWGTFVGQAGFPGIYDATLISNSEGYNIIVPWWQGYFWLFFVGLAWSGLAALYLGGYLFATKKYTRKDFINFFLLFTIGWATGLWVARWVIPHISPDAYYQVYLGYSSERNFKSMRDNFAFSFAIIPVLIYIIFKRRDWAFVGRTLAIMIIFGVGLSVADVWQMYGRNNLELGLPFWSMWEYYSGFIIGGLIMIFYYLIPPQVWHKSNLEFDYIPKTSRWESFSIALIERVNRNHKSKDQQEDFTSEESFNQPISSKLLCLLHTFPKKFRIYFIGHFMVFVYGLQESAIGMINGVVSALGGNFEISTWMGVLFILIVDVPLYVLYNRSKIGKKFSNKGFKQQSFILLIILIPLYFLFYFIPILVRGNFIPITLGDLATMHNLISAIVLEMFFIIKYCLTAKRGGFSTKA